MIKNSKAFVNEAKTWKENFKRKVRESLEIRRLKTGPNEPNGLNRDLGDYVTTEMLSSLLAKVNSIQRVPTFKSLTQIPSNDTIT